MKVEEFREMLLKLKTLHSSFEKRFSGIYGEMEWEALAEKVKDLYALSGEMLEVASSLYREAGGFGGRIEEQTKELYRNEHQMKFRLEEVLHVLARGKDYETRLKLSTALDRLMQFHKVYDYAVWKALSEIMKEVEELGPFLEGEKEKKVPSGIMGELEKIKKLQSEFETLRGFLFRLYTHPGDVHKVERALMDWHSRGLLWVEARNVEKLSGVEKAGEILEGLTLIGVVEKKMRGGEGVYRHRSFGSG
ncbi:hypothetical protein A3L12_03755 [Thermococcus sp. P6]|uniref:hypothetical protein n=1 Tax=Thermococcus sp. P6 TaxID=122420 RepID=UPI000B59C3DB|nr:hypothetical protein [Thermococcus sp. P6]ASJ10474.1 hypothetical protein A3L12_03755 [Thermococcus sp. P6]